MKKILIGLFILSSTTLFAQDNRDQHDRDNRDRNDVPKTVQGSFQRDYPNAQNPHWNNSNGQWHATYRDENNRDVEAHYNKYGHRIDTHITYREEDLPERLRVIAHRRYHSDYTPIRIERPNTQPLFQIKLQTGHTEYYDENGRKRTYYDHH